MEQSSGTSSHGCFPNPGGLGSPNMQSPQPGSWLETDPCLLCEGSAGGKVGEAGSGSVTAHPLPLSGKMTPWLRLLLKRRASTGHLNSSRSRTICSWTPSLTATLGSSKGRAHHPRVLRRTGSPGGEGTHPVPWGLGLPARLLTLPRALETRETVQRLPAQSPWEGGGSVPAPSG